MGRIRIDRADLRRAIRGASLGELRTAGQQVINRAKILAPVDTGRLRAAIKGKPKRSWTLRPRFEITCNVDYAAMVHDGTRPHMIRPRAGRSGRPKRGGGTKPTYLRFEIGGRVVYAREVRHPGTDPRPFLDRALREIAAPRGYSVRED